MRQAIFLALILGSPLHYLLAQNPSELLVIETIGIEGAQKTRHEVILNELTFTAGDQFSQEELEETLLRSRNNIFNLGLFNEVEIVPTRLREKVIILITVIERWYFLGSPYLQVEERNSYDLVNALLDLDFHRLVYGGSFQWKNVTGRNETITMFGQLGFSQKLRIDVLRPSLSRKKLDHRFGLGYQNQHEFIIGTEDGLAQWRRVDNEPIITLWKGYLGARRRFGIYRTLSAELRVEHYRFSDSLYAFSLENGPASTITTQNGREYFPSLVVQFYEDKRDYRSFPLSGWKYQLLGRVSGGPDGIATTSFGKIGLTWAHHLPISERINFAYGTQHLLSIGDSIPFFSKNFLGISQSEFIGVSTNLRGYEPYAISSTYMGVVKAEWKYAIVPKQILHFSEIPYQRFRDVQFGLYLSAFIDAAYLRDDAFNRADQTFHDQLLTGYGIGLNLIGFYDMLLRVEYARNHLNQGGFYFHTDLQIK